MGTLLMICISANFTLGNILFNLELAVCSLALLDMKEAANNTLLRPFLHRAFLILLFSDHYSPCPGFLKSSSGPYCGYL